MPSKLILPLALLATTTLCSAQDPTLPAVDGFVTHVDASGFDVNGHHILLGPKTGVGLKATGFVSVGNAHEFVAFLGERATIFGTRNDKAHSVMADRILFDPQKPGETEGFGIVDAVLPAPKGTQPGDRVVRADGYPVLISSKTRITADKSLPPNTPATTNMWLAFHGHQRADGIVVADKIALSQNLIKPKESKMLAKADFDPNTVPPDAQQGGFIRVVHGLDPKHIPPYINPTMQARVTAIGTRLIPQYQKDLPESDLTKIIFRFQLVDQKKLDHTISLPSGVILVPRFLVERSANDSQLAAVLADAIAEALEKQAWRGRDAEHITLAAEVGSVILFGLAPTVAGALITSSKIEQHREEQRDRVSLGLLHDASFDLTEAPRTWWLLSGKKDKDPAQIKLPHHASTMYDQIATTWRLTIAPTPVISQR